MLDVEKIAKLYEFGALRVYEVSYFDVITFTVKLELRTFSEARAMKVHGELEKSGFTASVRDYFVRFDGAYAIQNHQQ